MNREEDADISLETSEVGKDDAKAEGDKEVFKDPMSYTTGDQFSCTQCCTNLPWFDLVSQ